MMNESYGTTVFALQLEGLPGPVVHQKLQAALMARQPDSFEIESRPTAGTILKVGWNGWCLRAAFDNAPHVAQESFEWAQAHNFQPPWDVIAKCTRRIEIWCDADPNMDYFNNYLFILEA